MMNENDLTMKLWEWFAIGMLLICIGGLCYSLLFLAGWLGTATDVISPDNVREQWQFAYDMQESLMSGARLVCTAQVSYDRAQTDAERQQRETQLLARIDLYNQNAARYNARMQDAFRAKLVKPDDVRDRALPLLEAVTVLEVTEGISCGDFVPRGE